MSRRSGDEIDKKKRRTRKEAPAFRGFVNHTLTKQDKQDYARYELSEDFEGNVLPSLLEDGYRLSLSVDQRSGSFMGAISTKDSDSPNAGLVLTARSGATPIQAGIRAAFLHFIIFAEEWPDPALTDRYVDEWEVTGD